MAQSTSDCSSPADGFYRIRHSNPRLCLTLGGVGEDDVGGSSVYADEQQDIEGQKWRVQKDGGCYIIESSMSPGFYMGYGGSAKKYTQITAQEKKTKWYLESMFGSAYTIVEQSKKYAVGFSDYLPEVGDDAVLIDNVAAQSQIWYFEPWDLLKTDKAYLPATDTSLKDGKYQIVNVQTGFLMAVTDRPSGGPWYITKQRTERLNYKVLTLKRDGNKVTLKNTDVGVYVTISPKQPTVVAAIAASEKFVLGKQKGERGFFIMTENESQARRVIVDNRRTPEGFEFYPADIKKGDPAQRWEFKPYT